MEMKAIDFVLMYITKHATDEDKIKIKRIIDPFKAPLLNGEDVIIRLEQKCKEMYRQNGNKLNVVKYIKDVTGWGLKECKDWFEYIVPESLNYANKSENI